MLSWFVAKTKPHREGATAALLEACGIETYLPLCAPHRLRPRDREALFPGYLFVRFDPEVSADLLGVRSTNGVDYLVDGRDGANCPRPTALPDALIAEIRARIARHAGLLGVGGFGHGERTAVSGSAFDGFEAVFAGQLSASGRSRVFLEVLDRLGGVDLPDNPIDRLAPAA